ncbi:gliding motility lipoprotein GldD [Salegentibacter chungangensis]|uniref:Gliding motility lipoprotein GldD n=1 Tax=Salegentibacter chungangensis TaxID=1335724 RepID=A0ABW3NPV7_9FLAO
MRKAGILILTAILGLASCKDEVRPKPKAFLALEYPKAEYESADLACPYTFEKNKIAELTPSGKNKECWMELKYKLLNGSIYITYQKIDNNLDSLLMDAQQLPLQHTIKADVIEGDVYTNEYHNTYGMFYEVNGDAASQAQFYLTDSTDNFITGAIYFNRRPNYDSLVPAADYLKKDMRHLMETFQWN